jgi:hypothetical protein
VVEMIYNDDTHQILGMMTVPFGIKYPLYVSSALAACGIPVISQVRGLINLNTNRGVLEEPISGLLLEYSVCRVAVVCRLKAEVDLYPRRHRVRHELFSALQDSES